MGEEAPTFPTRPSDTTGAGPSRPGRPHVRWIFPSPLLTPVAGTVVIGRGKDCDAVLDGEQISRHHAELRVEEGRISVRDLGSRNGVFVNGQRHQEAPLHVGDVVRCGEWIGVHVEHEDGVGFRSIAPDWFGGAALAAAVDPARRVSPTLPIVIQGETGTGKEGIARTIHQWSQRAGPFLAVNCAALPVNLAESELFGFRRGAFSGADQGRPGLFRAAERGTLFLDEVLDLPLPVQGKLLRVLEEKEVLPLGETQPVPVDVRVVVAAQSPLRDAVRDARFRADLHARLDGLTIELPPLRQRREDVTPLFLELWRREISGPAPVVDPKLVEALCLYDWPQNVRELVLLVRQLAGMHRGESRLGRRHLPDRMRSPTPTSDSNPPPLMTPGVGPSVKRQWRRTDDEDEFAQLVAALNAHGGSVSRAAAALGMHRSRAYRLLAAHPEYAWDPGRKSP